MPFDSDYAVFKRTRVTQVGSVLTYDIYWHSSPMAVPEGVGAVMFLTRWGRFTEASLNAPWKMLGKVRMVGPWFDGDEVYAIVAGRDLTGIPAGNQTYVVTEHIDSVGIPLDAPIIRPAGWMPQMSVTSSQIPRSAAVITDFLTGERETVPMLVWEDMPGYWRPDNFLHIAQRDAAAMLDYYEHTGLGVESPLAPFRYEKTSYLDGGNYDNGNWDKAYLRTKSTVKWADGTTEERVRVGADTKVQRIAVQFSTALPTPSKPTILGGSPQWVDPAAQSTLTLAYAAGIAGDQAKLVWKRTIGADVKYWNQTTQAWQAGVFENVRSQPNTTFPAAAFPADSTFTIQVAAKGAVGDLSEYSDATILDTNPIPTATIELTPYDVGTEVTTSLSPTVSVDGTPAENQTLESYIVEVLDSDGARFAYADVAGLSPWVVDPALPNNTTGWTVRARVRQSGGALSDWVSLPFDVAAVTPGAPTVTVTAVNHETSELPILRLTVDLPWETDGFDYATNTISLLVDRSTDDGATWTQVGTVTPTPGWASGIVLDDEAPSHLPALYRVHAEATTQYGGLLVGAATDTTVPAMVIASEQWLSPVGFPELAVPVALVTAEEGKITTGQGGTAIIGAPYQVVTGVTSVLAEGGYVARTDTPEDEAALVSLLSGGHLLTLSMCPERDSSNTLHPVGRRWFRTVGDIGVARVLQGPWSMRLVSWNAVPQAAPMSVGG